MKTILTWMIRGGITAALFMMIVSVWPSGVVEHSQFFALNADDPIQAEILFRAPEKLLRGAKADLSVLLNLERVLAANEKAHPVMVYRLEMAGAEVVPDAVFQIPLAGVQHQEVRWRVRLPHAGAFEGTWWVYVEYVGQGGEIIERQALFARRFTIESREILGLSMTGTRWVSMLVIVLGLGFEIWSNLRRKSSSD